MNGRFKFLGCMILLAAFCRPALANQCAAPGNDGSGAFSGVVNTYWAATDRARPGDTQIELGSSRGALQSIQPNDLLLVIQMQAARIDRSNDDDYGDGQNGDPATGYTDLEETGVYEFVRATNTIGAGGGTLTIASGLINDYDRRNASGGRGQRSFQVVRVPQYVDLTISGTLTATPWDGESGGVVAIDVGGTLTFAGGAIDVSGRGFRGGGGRASTSGSGDNDDYRTNSSNLANGSKGEGVAGTPRFVFAGTGVINTGSEGIPSGSFARGAPGNAGGGGTDGRPSANDQNTGGGGGGGFASGGRGGHAWCPGGPSVCPQSGGFGGSGVVEQAADLLVMGGGGGAGTTNNATGTPGGGVASSGATGGGIIIVRAGTITGSGTLRADGSDANQTVDNDGSGGGGGGGAILLVADTNDGALLSASARGGRGGSNGNSTPHGPGGGGGGGFVALNAPMFGTSVVVAGGIAGTTEGNPAPFTSNYGATSGSSGISTTISGLQIPGLSSGGECSVRVGKSFAPVSLGVNSPTRLTLTLRNPNPTLPLNALSLTDNYPSDLENAPSPNPNNGCGGSLVATPGGNTLALSGASLTAGASCTLEVDVIATTPGSFTNTIAIGDADATIASRPVRNLVPAQATVTVIEPLVVTKTVAVISDPVGGAGDPFAIPGAIAEYTILVSNPSAVPIDNAGLRVTDVLPDTTTFLNVDLGAGLPVVLINGGGGGLSLNAAGLVYSDDEGASYGYGPSAGADPDVDALRITPNGSLAPGASVTLRFRVLVN